MRLGKAHAASEHHRLQPTPSEFPAHVPEREEGDQHDAPAVSIRSPRHQTGPHSAEASSPQVGWHEVPFEAFLMPIGDCQKTHRGGVLTPSPSPWPLQRNETMQLGSPWFRVHRRHHLIKKTVDIPDRLFDGWAGKSGVMGRLPCHEGFPIGCALVNKRLKAWQIQPA